MAGGEALAKKSDLKLRVLSAIAMVGVAGLALWAGSWLWTTFVAFVALGVLWEWSVLVRGFEPRGAFQAAWMALGGVYIGLAGVTIALLRLFPQPVAQILLLAMLVGVIATDIGAYFAGRAIGGPKIAPAISPSKTWAGLGGGMLAAGIAMIAVTSPFEGLADPVWKLLVGSVLAVIAQCGDFFESWMKRKAGVKDSGHLIPGHGGLFDRVDGLLAVSTVFGLYVLIRFLLWS